MDPKSDIVFIKSAIEASNQLLSIYSNEELHVVFETEFLNYISITTQKTLDKDLEDRVDEAKDFLSNIVKDLAKEAIVYSEVTTALATLVSERVIQKLSEAGQIALADKELLIFITGIVISIVFNTIKENINDKE